MEGFSRSHHKTGDIESPLFESIRDAALWLRGFVSGKSLQDLAVVHFWVERMSTGISTPIYVNRDAMNNSTEDLMYHSSCLCTQTEIESGNIFDKLARLAR